MTQKKIVIRPAQLEDAPALARVHVDTWRTTYPGIIPAEHLANLSYERSQTRWEEHLSNPGQERVFVVEEPSGAIAGFVTGGPIREALQDYDAEIYGLYIRKAFQGLGYGRLLVHREAQTLAGLGFLALVIWVLNENPACRFYERMGGIRVGEKTIEIGNKALVEAAYGWPQLDFFKAGDF